MLFIVSPAKPMLYVASNDFYSNIRHFGKGNHGHMRSEIVKYISIRVHFLNCLSDTDMLFESCSVLLTVS